MSSSTGVAEFKSRESRPAYWEEAYYLGNGGGGGDGPGSITGPQGATGTNTTAGATGPTGPNGIASARGNTGPTGLPGVASAVGATGPKGDAGAALAQGPTGPTGPSGTNTTAGATGPTGPNGIASAVGNTGATGVPGVASAVGATGPKGDAGSALAAGATGPTGASGVNTTVGATGPTGPDGSSVAIGNTGPTGPQGVASAVGNTGPTGPQGVASAVGNTGPTGPNGIASAVGNTGPTGPDGIASAVGNTGPTGPDGIASAVGNTGPTGPDGIASAVGNTGPTGPAGATGPKGNPGVLSAYPSSSIKIESSAILYSYINGVNNMGSVNSPCNRLSTFGISHDGVNTDTGVNPLGGYMWYSENKVSGVASTNDLLRKGFTFYDVGSDFDTYTPVPQIIQLNFYQKTLVRVKANIAWRPGGNGSQETMGMLFFLAGTSSSLTDLTAPMPNFTYPDPTRVSGTSYINQAYGPPMIASDPTETVVSEMDTTAVIDFLSAPSGGDPYVGVFFFYTKILNPPSSGTNYRTYLGAVDPGDVQSATGIGLSPVNGNASGITSVYTIDGNTAVGPAGPGNYYAGGPLFSYSITRMGNYFSIA